MEKVTCEVFRYEELTDNAKEKVREWYLNTIVPSLWWDVVVDSVADGVNAGLKMAGITVEDGPYYDLHRQTVGGKYTFGGDAGGWHEEAMKLYRYYKDLSEKDPKSAYAICARDLLAAATSVVEEAVEAGAASVWCELSEGQRGLYPGLLEVYDDEGEVLDTPEGVEEAARNLAEEIRSFVLMIAQSESDYAESEEYMKRFFEANDYRFTRSGRWWEGC